MPDNIDGVPEMDKRIREGLRARKRDIALSKDSDLEKAQGKFRKALGPLAKALKHAKASKDKRARKAILQTGILLGQGQLHLTVMRRKNILLQFLGHSKAKRVAADNVDALIKETAVLFGRAFKEAIQKEDMQSIFEAKPDNGQPSRQWSNQGANNSQQQQRDRGQNNHRGRQPFPDSPRNAGANSASYNHNQRRWRQPEKR